MTATIAGAPLALNRWLDGVTARHRPRRAFIGYLRHAGIGSRLHVLDTNPPPSPPAVRLTIRYTGRTVVTRLRVPLEPGWG
ncbi:MAG: hypothetical protein ACRDK8_06330 [Solirubrobacteraceae bacterium]